MRYPADLGRPPGITINERVAVFISLRTRRFLPLFLTQALGALNDNLFRNALAFLAVYRIGTVGGIDGPQLVSAAAGVFLLPFFLFSATGGQLADKFDKAGLIKWIKAAEIAIMAGAAVGFLAGSVSLLFAVLFLMGTHSALFGPVKYSILPDHLRRDEIIGGNALIEAATFSGHPDRHDCRRPADPDRHGHGNGVGHRGCTCDVRLARSRYIPTAPRRRPTSDQPQHRGRDLGHLPVCGGATGTSS